MNEARRTNRVVDLAVDLVPVVLLTALLVALAQTEAGQQLLRLIEQTAYYGLRGGLRGLI